jgi:putative phosphoesterase
MRIGLLSDTHDNLASVQAAAAVLVREEISVLLHCGDVCGPSIIEALDGFTVYLAQGNMDRMPALGTAVQTLREPGRLARCHDLALEGFRVALVHGDDGGLLRRLIQSGAYAYVFHGHTHRRGDRQVGSTRVINPGALGGLRRGPRSFCVLDLQTGAARFHELESEVETG